MRRLNRWRAGRKGTSRARPETSREAPLGFRFACGAEDAGSALRVGGRRPQPRGVVNQGRFGSESSGPALRKYRSAVPATPRSPGNPRARGLFVPPSRRSAPRPLPEGPGRSFPWHGPGRRPTLLPLTRGVHLRGAHDGRRIPHLRRCLRPVGRGGRPAPLDHRPDAGAPRDSSGGSSEFRNSRLCWGQVSAADAPPRRERALGDMP